MLAARAAYSHKINELLFAMYVEFSVDVASVSNCCTFGNHQFLLHTYERVALRQDNEYFEFAWRKTVFKGNILAARDDRRLLYRFLGRSYGTLM